MLSAVLICLLFGIAQVFSIPIFYFRAERSHQVWNYTTVRESAHMFWWLYYTTANVSNPTQKPLIIWLQGGPGGSSTGLGNFGEIGQLDVDLNPRNSNWVQYANVLFVDNPVGCGFSYVDDDKAYAMNNTQIAQDFLVFLKEFYISLPDFRTVPLYIFGQSYGGKMAAEIALAIDKATKNEDIQANLTGIALGDSWISPIDSVMSWAPYLLNLGIVDETGYKLILNITNDAKYALEKGDYNGATNNWFRAEMLINILSNNIDFYNVLIKEPVLTSNPRLNSLFQQSYDPDMKHKLTDIMNNKIKPELNISTLWKYVNMLVFNHLYSDFMKPVTNVVEEILNTTNIRIAIYNGQLDLIVDTRGTLKWVDDLNFKGKEKWNAASRVGFAVDEYYEGYVKKQGTLAFYWVDRSGHYVPQDNPSAMLYILREVTNNFEV